MQGKKTHEQQLRTLERKPDMPKAGDPPRREDPPPKLPHDHDPARGDLPVYRQGGHQEDHHNKHNDPGQRGHKPQR